MADSAPGQQAGRVARLIDRCWRPALVTAASGYVLAGVVHAFGQESLARVVATVAIAVVAFAVPAGLLGGRALGARRAHRAQRTPRAYRARRSNR